MSIPLLKIILKIAAKCTINILNIYLILKPILCTYGMIKMISRRNSYPLFDR